MFVHLIHSQKYSDLIEGLEDAFFSFGGVVARVALDNLKAAVFKGDLYDPIFQRVFEEYADYRGFVIDACVPRHPTGKPTVERSVPYVRENFFRGESFRDRTHAQEEALRWCLGVAGTRIHGTTRQRPLAVFENIEKAALRPLERGRFDPPVWGQCKVHRDHHINFQKAIYSLPSKFVGKKVWVRADRKLLRVYTGGELVKTHPLQAPGGRSTDFADYPKEKTAYAMRDPNRLIRAARERGEYMGQFMAELLSGAFPWANLRQGQKLLRLVEKYGAQRLEQACERALAFELINVRRLEKIVRNHLEGKSPVNAKAVILELPLRFAREPKSFTHPNQGEDPWSK
jgi:hypothetical protein